VWWDILLSLFLTFTAKSGGKRILKHLVWVCTGMQNIVWTTS